MWQSLVWDGEVPDGKHRQFGHCRSQAQRKEPGKKKAKMKEHVEGESAGWKKKRRSRAVHT